ncbi:hypothetical protein KEM48_011926 [Puccinia striiformis f. sp. tritici PST-130]|nr:hypothetical protein KEM48_011926 [Puccinia striiformis f. sp. tritici PST-130]
MDEISRTNNDNELSNMSSALEELPGFSGLDQACRRGRRIAILGPGRTATDQGINPASTPVPRPVDRELPAARPVPTSGRPERLQPYSAHSDPSTDREVRWTLFDIRPESLTTVSTVNGRCCPSPRIPGHLDDEICSQRGRWNSNMMQNIVGREEMIRLSLNWNAREDLAP